MKITLEDMRTATQIVEYANINWRGFFSKEECRQFAKDILTDEETLRTYLNGIAEDIDISRDHHLYDDVAIDLYNKGKEILKRMTA